MFMREYALSSLYLVSRFFTYKIYIGIEKEDKGSPRRVLIGIPVISQTY
jgi:hypothetical protein